MMKRLCSLRTSRSNEGRAVMHGVGVGQSQSQDCGFHLGSATALPECTHEITETPPYNCKRCHVSFKGKGS